MELAQLNAGWQKFQKQVEDEYQQQKQKFLDKQKMIKEGLAKAEEEYAAAQEALRDAAVGSDKPPEVPPPNTTPTEQTGEDSRGWGFLRR